MAHENATPRPWVLSVNDDEESVDITSEERIYGSYVPIARTDVGYSGPIGVENEANPALIVEAVNAYDTLRAENERLEGDLNASEQERGIALSALRLAADRLHEEGAPQAYVDDARSVLLGFTPEGDRVLRPEVTPEQVAALFDELSKGPVQGGKNAQIAYAKCAKIVRSKLVRAASSEPAQ